MTRNSKAGKVVKPPVKYSEVLDGINPLSEFSRSIEKDAPEFRSTLCWLPTVTTDGNGRASFDFYTTDDVGEMIIQLEGVTKNGQPFLNRLPIIVR